MEDLLVPFRLVPAVENTLLGVEREKEKYFDVHFEKVHPQKHHEQLDDGRVESKDPELICLGHLQVLEALDPGL